MRAPVLGLALVLALGPALAWGCVPAGGAPGPASGSPEPGRNLVPAGYGSLRQEEFTVTLRDGAVQVKVTPLAEWVIRLAAPDTYRRLAGAVARVDRGETEGRLPVLVSLFTDAAGGAEVEIRDLELVNRGRRFRPLAIHGLTSDWGSGRLPPRTTHQAVYLFEAGVDLEMELVVEFGGARGDEWNRILPRLETERARVRARAGGGPSRASRGTRSPGAAESRQSSSPNFLIFR